MQRNRRIKTLHIITGVGDGGAEAVLYRLCREDRKNQHSVVSLKSDGKHGPLLREIGVPVACLDMPPGRFRLRGIWKLWRLLREQEPDIVQTWMYHGDFFGGVVARLAGLRRVVWGLHHTTLEAGKSKRSTIFLARICAMLSHAIPTKIICCADSTLSVHKGIGYDAAKLVVVNNGYDLGQFHPNKHAGAGVRQELNIPLEARLVGMVARFDPQKDHRNFLDALSRVRAEGNDLYCLLVGQDVNAANSQLIGWIKGFGLTERVRLAGQRSDIPAVMNALDVHVLSSAYGEAFPNVLSEAMACGTPCVATDVGDAALILGETGWIAPAKDAAALADRLARALEAVGDREGWSQRERAARSRIQERFSVQAMADGYRQVWDSTLIRET